MNAIEHAHLNIAAASHPGMAGKKNEDRYGLSAFLVGPKGDTPSVLAVLCDGIGGHRAGEVAAQMGVSAITEQVTASDGEQPLKTLAKAIKQANHAIYEASLSAQGREGMGTTCACAWVIDDKLFTANLGDSRIYLLRAGHILQLTTDHTWLQEAYDAGIINEEEGDLHPNAHVIRRYLGSSKAPQPDFRLWFFEGESDADAMDNQGLPLEPGDVLLLCSDGLTDLVTDEEIQTVINSTALEQAPAVLIDLANARGGHDNSTVVLMGVPPKKTGEIRRGRKRRWLTGCLAGLVVLGLLVSALYFGMRWRSQRTSPVLSSPPAATQPVGTQLPVMTEVTQPPATPGGTTLTPADEADLTTPLPTITPWPTHTSAP